MQRAMLSCDVTYSYIKGSIRTSKPCRVQVLVDASAASRVIFISDITGAWHTKSRFCAPRAYRGLVPGVLCMAVAPGIPPSQLLWLHGCLLSFVRHEAAAVAADWCREHTDDGPSFWSGDTPMPPTDPLTMGDVLHAVGGGIFSEPDCLKFGGQAQTAFALAWPLVELLAVWVCVGAALPTLPEGSLEKLPEATLSLLMLESALGQPGLLDTWQREVDTELKAGGTLVVRAYAGSGSFGWLRAAPILSRLGIVVSSMHVEPQQGLFNANAPTERAARYTDEVGKFCLVTAGAMDQLGFMLRSAPTLSSAAPLLQNFQRAIADGTHPNARSIAT